MRAQAPHARLGGARAQALVSEAPIDLDLEDLDLEGLLGRELDHRQHLEQAMFGEHFRNRSSIEFTCYLEGDHCDRFEILWF